MKVYFVLLLVLLFSCKDSVRESDTQRLENYLEQLFHRKVTATIYVVHPNVCGACSNDFLLNISNNKTSSSFYLLATGSFKPENNKAVRKLGERVKLVSEKKLARLGLSTTLPYKIILKKGKVLSIEDLNLTSEIETN